MTTTTGLLDVWRRRCPLRSAPSNRNKKRTQPCADKFTSHSRARIFGAAKKRWELEGRVFECFHVVIEVNAGLVGRSHGSMGSLSGRFRCIGRSVGFVWFVGGQHFGNATRASCDFPGDTFILFIGEKCRGMYIRRSGWAKARARVPGTDIQTQEYKHTYVYRRPYEYKH